MASKSPKKGVVDQADLSSAITPSESSAAPAGETKYEMRRRKQREAKQAQRDRDKGKEGAPERKVSASGSVAAGRAPKVRASQEQLDTTASKLKANRKDKVNRADGVGGSSSNAERAVAGAAGSRFQAERASMVLRASGLRESEASSSDQVGEQAGSNAQRERSKRGLQQRRHYKVGMGPAEGAPGYDWRQVNAPNTSNRMLTPDITGPSEHMLVHSDGVIKATTDPEYKTLGGQNRRSHFLFGHPAVSEKSYRGLIQKGVGQDEILSTAMDATNKHLIGSMSTVPGGAIRPRAVPTHPSRYKPEASVFDKNTKKWSVQPLKEGLDEVKTLSAGKVVRKTNKTVPESTFAAKRLYEAGNRSEEVVKLYESSKPVGKAADYMDAQTRSERSAALQKIIRDSKEIVKINRDVAITRDASGKRVVDGEIDLSPASDDPLYVSDREYESPSPDLATIHVQQNRKGRSRAAKKDIDESTTPEQIRAAVVGKRVARSKDRMDADIQRKKDSQKTLTYSINEYAERPKPVYQTRIEKARASVDAEYAKRHARALKDTRGALPEFMDLPSGNPTSEISLKRWETIKDAPLPDTPRYVTQEQFRRTYKPENKRLKMQNPPPVKIRKASPEFESRYKAERTAPGIDMRHLGAAPDRPVSSLDPITPGSNRWEKNKVTVAVEGMHTPVRYRTAGEFAANEAMNRAYTRQERAAASMSTPTQPSTFKKVKGAKVNPQNTAAAAPKERVVDRSPETLKANIAKAEALRTSGPRAGQKTVYNANTGVTRRFDKDGKEIK